MRGCAEDAPGREISPGSWSLQRKAKALLIVSIMSHNTQKSPIASCRNNTIWLSLYLKKGGKKRSRHIIAPNNQKPQIIALQVIMFKDSKIPGQRTIFLRKKHFVVELE